MFGVRHFATALSASRIFRLQICREPHEYRASCVVGRAAGGRQQDAVVFIRTPRGEGSVVAGVG